MNRIPDLEAWVIFAKVAEVGSFAKAATAFSLSQATVSKAISRIEARMNTVLLNRTPRGISLTEIGLVALERATRILEDGEAVEAEVTEQSTSLRGTIRVSAPMAFGVARLSPMLPDFMRDNPDVRLDVHFSDEFTDLIANRFDLALRISRLVDSSLLARHLGTVRILLVGAPSYFERYGKPEHPSDLVHHRLLQYSYSRDGSSWKFRHDKYGDFVQVVPIHFRSNNAAALSPALHAGLGLALHPEFLAWQDLQSGKLETVMEDWQVDPITLHIVTPPGRRRPVRIRAFIDYLIDRFETGTWAEQ